MAPTDACARTNAAAPTSMNTALRILIVDSKSSNFQILKSSNPNPQILRSPNQSSNPKFLKSSNAAIPLDPSHAQIFYFEVFLDPIFRAFSADPRLLHPAERGHFGRNQ